MARHAQGIDAKGAYSQQFRASEVRTGSTYSLVGRAPIGGKPDDGGRGEYARHHHCARAASVASGSAGFWTVGEPAAARGGLVSRVNQARLSAILVRWESGRLLAGRLR